MRKRFMFGILAPVLIIGLTMGTGMAQDSPPAEAATLGLDTRWIIEEVDTATQTGGYTSIVVDNIPYIAYYNFTDGDLYLTSPVEPGEGNCGPSDNWDCRTVDTQGDVGRYTSIDIYRSSTILGSWKLGIAYHDATNHALKLAEYICYPLMGCDWFFTTIDSGGGGDVVGTYVSFVYDDSGKGHIAYQAFDYGSAWDFYDLRYAHEVGSGGTGCDMGITDWQCDTVQIALANNSTNGFPGIDLTLLYFGNSTTPTPFIAYYDSPQKSDPTLGGNLNLAYFVNQSGSGCEIGPTWQCDAIEGTDPNPEIDTGLSPQIYIQKTGSEYYTNIFYYDKANGALRWARAASLYQGAEANCGPIEGFNQQLWRCDDVDTLLAGWVGGPAISLALDEAGYPVLAYQSANDDLAPSSLEMARPAGRAGVNFGIGNCGDPLPSPGMLFSYWQCEIIDQGGGQVGSIDEANFTAVGVDSDGLITIGYEESDDYDDPEVDILKVAYQEQYYTTAMPIVIK
ncbi:MAG: hypothetical protein JW726_10735 [Anaerolineales bacterium]|nr:hypothetical protein [Anaerolineales bacterium]